MSVASPAASVIATFYNRADAARTCVESLLAQAFGDLEVVLVDNGSEDGTSELLDSYAADARVHVVHRPVGGTGGAGGARGAGVQASKGRYLTFVDGDDVVGPLHVRALYDTLVRSGAGMSCVRHAVLSEKAALAPAWTDASGWRLLVGNDAVRALLYERIYEAPWAKMAPRELYEAHPFPEGRSYEDVAIAGTHVIAAGSVAACEATTYGYIMHPASVVNQRAARIAQAEDFVWAIEQMLDPIEASCSDVDDAVAFRRVLEYLRLHALLVRVADDRRRAEELDCAIVDELRDLLPVLRADKDASRRTVWRARLLALSPAAYDGALRLYERAFKQV